MQIGETKSDRLTNLRFADDLLLVATTRSQITTMIAGLKKAAASVGLQLHMGKTKILTNRFSGSVDSGEHCEIDGERIDVLGADETTMYLGRSLNLRHPQEAEMDARMRAAWRAFHARKSELCNKQYSLHDRLRLFDATVTKSALYGSETWTMSVTDRERLRSTQRKMLRWMIGAGRRKDGSHENEEEGKSETSDDSSGNGSDCSTNSTPSSSEGGLQQQVDPAVEDFRTWIKRVTKMAESVLAKLHIEDWVKQQRRQYWRWAGHVLRLHDGRWTVRVLGWEPREGSRAVGRPRKRWIDDLNEYASRSRRLKFILRHCGESVVEQDGKFCTNLWRKLWKKHEDQFVGEA